MNIESHPALIGMLRQLPPPGEPLAEEYKQEFMRVFRVVLDYIYPTKVDVPPDSAGG
jgi:hypothetical protein